MASKVFVSYKHRDGQVQQLVGRTMPEYGRTTVRNYVDVLDEKLTALGHICKAEDSGDDMSGLSDDAIAAKLAARIHDSTVTVVLISKGMNSGAQERAQWIPWEVSYSMTENTRGGRTSATNAMIAVALPDENGSYEYFVKEHGCLWCRARTWLTTQVFGILGNNMFNRNEKKLTDCTNGSCGLKDSHTGNDHSYIQPVKWSEFTADINGYINLALERQEKLTDFNIQKRLA